MSWDRKRGCRLFLNVSQNTLCCSRRRVLASRIILGLTLLLLLVMPLTEQVWAGDEFLNGGHHDVELSLLSELAFCGLVALAADQVIGSPLLEWFLVYRARRTSLRKLLRGASFAMPVALNCRPYPQRCVDLSVPLSLMSLRI